MCKIKIHRIIKKPVILKYSYQKLKKLICDMTCFLKNHLIKISQQELTFKILNST